jgi:hypothetical protein
MKNTSHTLMDPLAGMEASDREALLAMEPSLWLGRIIQLNQQPRYNNSLNAIELMCDLKEVRRTPGSYSHSVSRA